MPGEEAALVRAVPKRRREFLAGRALARHALRSLGIAPVAIPAAEDRSPVWPEGIAGSISHCADLCVVAAGRMADGFLSVGLDVEPAAALEANIVSEICSLVESRWLVNQHESERGMLARIIFSAKECAYKCQYPLSRRLLDFHDMRIEIDQAEGRFVARFCTDAAPFRSGDELCGKFAIIDDHIVTGMGLRREHLIGRMAA